MARDGYRIIDADRHVIEPIDLWKRYLPPEHREGAPYQQFIAPDESLAERVARLGPAALIPLPPALMIDGEPVWDKLSEAAQLEMARAIYQRPGGMAQGATADGQLKSMDATGVDVAFLYPSFGLFLLAIDGMAPARASAFARAYNDWLADFCRPAPERLRGVGAVSRHDPAEMVAELERVAGFGWRAVVLWPNPVKGRVLGDPSHEPFWTACERLSIAVALHDGTHARLPTAGADRFDSRFALHACSHPMEQMMGLLSLIEGGVLERHPDLRVGLLEAGCGWLPYWLWRLDELSYKYQAGEVARNVRRKPSEYFRRQCFVAVEPDEPYLPELLGHVGEDNVIFGTDFPHVDREAEIVDEAVALASRLPEGALRKMLWDNPGRFYGL